MKCLLFAVATTAFSPSGSSARPSSTGPFTEGLTETLLTIERQILAAYVNRDSAILERDLAVEYVHTNLIGQREDKAEEIAEFSPGGAFTLTSGTVDHGVARRYGDVAVLRADVHWMGAVYQPPGGKPVDVRGTYSVTGVYVHRDGRWQLATSHASRQSRT